MLDEWRGDAPIKYTPFEDACAAARARPGAAELGAELQRALEEQGIPSVRTLDAHEEQFLIITKKKK